MEAIMQGCAAGDINGTVCTVLSNNPQARGLLTAAAAGIETSCIDHRKFKEREAFDAAVVADLNRCTPDLVVLAGFMRILTPVFTSAFAGRLLNIHPSLLPKYPGLHTHRRALEAGDAEAGATVHFVTPQLDGGPPIVQARVAVDAADTPESLAERVMALEHIIYPLAVKWYAQGRLRLTDQGAHLDGNPLPTTGVIYTSDTL